LSFWASTAQAQITAKTNKQTISKRILSFRDW
jgi:hypothetical protein